MSNFSLYKYRSKKPFLLMEMEIGDETRYWVIPKSDPVQRNVPRLAIEHTGEFDTGPEGKKLIIEKCDVKIDNQGKRKINFRILDSKMDVKDFVLLIPSWGLRTTNKIWVLIPVH